MEMGKESIRKGGMKKGRGTLGHGESYLLGEGGRGDEDHQAGEADLGGGDRAGGVLHEEGVEPKE